jgi:hypothetical protein
LKAIAEEYEINKKDMDHVEGTRTPYAAKMPLSMPVESVA